VTNARVGRGAGRALLMRAGARVPRARGRRVLSCRRGSTVGEGARGRAGVRTYNSAVADAEGGAFELGTDGPKVILVGVDDSVTSMRAGAYAAGLARRQGARLVCVYVERPSAIYGAAAGAGASAIAAQEQALHETATELRREAEEGARRLGLALTFVVARGDPTPNCGGWPTRCAPTPSLWAPRCRPGTGGSGRWRYGWSRPAGGRSPWSPRHCSAHTDPQRSREAG